jgi:hypothetical protein
MLFVLAVALAPTFSSPSVAQREPQVIDLRPGYTLYYQFDRIVRTIAIGNPEIADATVQSDRAMLITAKRQGETNLIGLDENGIDFFHAVVIVGGGITGRIQIHSRSRIQEYYTYRCTIAECQRIEDKFEYTPPPAQIVVLPPAQPGAPAVPAAQ